MKDASADPGKSVATIGQKHGWETFQPQLTSVMKGTTTETMERNVRLLESICTARPRKKEGWGEPCPALARSSSRPIESIDRRTPRHDWRPRVDRAAVLAGMARSLSPPANPSCYPDFLDHTFATPTRYPLTEVHIKALAEPPALAQEECQGALCPLAKWLDLVREQLEALTAREPEKPADFRRAAPMTCTCADCAELKRFLEDPREALHRFKAAKERRRHLHSQIDATRST